MLTGCEVGNQYSHNPSGMFPFSLNTTKVKMADKRQQEERNHRKQEQNELEITGKEVTD